jgi:integrase
MTSEAKMIEQNPPTFTAAQVAEIIAQANDDAVGTAVRIAAETGLRVGEVLTCTHETARL